jgi:hypothetical protein
MSDDILAKERSVPQITPLHFIVAANWLEGVEVLVAHSVDKYAQDASGMSPLDVAIQIESVPVVEILLREGHLPYIFQRGKYQDTTLPSSFLNVAKSNNEELQNVVVDTLARFRHQLVAMRPYHDLATISGRNARLVAEKLFFAGFRNI